MNSSSRTAEGDHPSEDHHRGPARRHHGDVDRQLAHVWLFVARRTSASRILPAATRRSGRDRVVADADFIRPLFFSQPCIRADALLRLDDLLGELHFGILAEGEHRFRHVDGAGMMRDAAFDGSRTSALPVKAMSMAPCIFMFMPWGK